MTIVPNVIYNEDCIKGMSRIPDRSIDAIICDLPYGTTHNKWDVVIPFENLWKQYKRIIKDSGVIILFGQGMFTAKLVMSNPNWWRYNLVWQKTQPTGFLNAHKMPLRTHEDICIFYKNLPVYNPLMTQGVRKVSSAKSKRNCVKTTNYGTYKLADYDSDKRYPTSVLKFSKDVQHSAIHPTQKPVALLEWLIKTYTTPGALVLDNCSGSGTTILACIKTGRNYIGFETNEKYYKQSINRIEKFEQSTNCKSNYFMTKKIIFASKKGGTGKSTLCAMVANHLARNGKKVAVIDGDNCSTLTWRRKSDMKQLPADDVENSIPYSIFHEDDYDKVCSLLSDYDYVLFDNVDSTKPKPLSEAEQESGMENVKVLIPFIYSEMVIDSTFRYIKNLSRNYEIYFVPNEVNGYKQSIKKKDTIETINWILSIFGKILPKVGNFRLLEQVNTIGNTVEQNQFIREFVNALFPDCPMTEEEITSTSQGEETHNDSDDTNPETDENISNE